MAPYFYGCEAALHGNLTELL